MDEIRAEGFEGVCVGRKFKTPKFRQRREGKTALAASVGMLLGEQLEGGAGFGGLTVGFEQEAETIVRGSGEMGRRVGIKKLTASSERLGTLVWLGAIGVRGDPKATLCFVQRGEVERLRHRHGGGGRRKLETAFAVDAESVVGEISKAR